MIKKLTLIIILFTGCSTTSLPFTLTDTAKYINGYLFGYESDRISREYFNSKKYTFASIKFGRGPTSIVTLLKIHEDGSYEWISSDKIRVFTKNGMIYKTIGLPHDVNYSIDTKNRSDLLPSAFEFRANFYNPDLKYAKGYSEIISTSDDTIIVLEEELRVNKVEFVTRVFPIKWSTTSSIYYQGKYPKRTLQKVHPRVPVIKMDFYYIF